MSTSICTIGTSKKSLKKFIDLLQSAKVSRLVDTRLNNTSQLAGFSKKNDLAYIMKLVGISYTHELSLAPTGDILEAYKKNHISWNEYEKRYLDLLAKRKIENQIDDILSDEVTCFLCSEEKPHKCHRRLLAEYLREHKQKVEIFHLL